MKSKDTNWLKEKEWKKIYQGNTCHKTMRMAISDRINQSKEYSQG